MADILIVQNRRAERATVNPLTQPAKRWVRKNMTVDPPVSIDGDAVRELQKTMEDAGLSVEVA